MKMEPIVSSETSATKSQTPGNYPKRNKLHLQHGESLRTRLTLYCPDLEEIKSSCFSVADFLNLRVVTHLILM